LGSRRVKRLKGFEGLFRYRVGELRVIFSVDRVDRVVKVMTIGPRRDIY
jgi:mRNA interferase RelE/StbE